MNIPRGHRGLVGTLPNLNIESSTDLIVDLAHKRRLQQSVPSSSACTEHESFKVVVCGQGLVSLCPEDDHVRVFIERYSLVSSIKDFRVVKWVRVHCRSR